MTEHVIVIDEGPIRLVRMNRLDKMNAITDDMYDKLAGALEGAATDKAIHCVVITGGKTVFSAGSDLNDFLHAAQHMEGLRPAVGRFLRGLVHTEKPVVAGVQGVAIGIGMTMLLHFDYVVAANNARFSAPFAELGVVPEAGSSLLAPRLMGTRRAFALLVMGRPMDAQEAKAVGLVNILVPPEKVEEEVMKAAH
jgi:enoyl-CoA hydratase/carnithine racemase